jgi:tRNA-dihydrouridine synthase C
MAAEGGATWITIHGRTRVAGYSPPAYWRPIGLVRERLAVPVVANGDIWTIEDFRRCREETGCIHFMLGRGALANPALAGQAARELGLAGRPHGANANRDWSSRLCRLAEWTDHYEGPGAASKRVHRLKQWLKLAANFGDFREFESIKRAQSVAELLDCLAQCAALAA